MLNQALPVMIQTRIIDQNGMLIYYPQVYGLANDKIQKKINQEIFAAVNYLMEQQHELQDFNYFNEIIGLYEIKTNERNILSISFTNYAISEHAAHGLTIMKSLTFNVQTGKTYSLAELFKPNSNYVEVFSNLISKQIKARDIPLLEPFTKIQADQDFYIADKSLVIYFQAYEITAGYLGFPMFPISVYTLENIIKETGPLGIMATNN